MDTRKAVFERAPSGDEGRRGRALPCDLLRRTLCFRIEVVVTIASFVPSSRPWSPCGRRGSRFCELCVKAERPVKTAVPDFAEWRPRLTAAQSRRVSSSLLLLVHPQGTSALPRPTFVLAKCRTATTLPKEAPGRSRNSSNNFSSSNNKRNSTPTRTVVANPSNKPSEEARTATLSSNNKHRR